MNSDLLSLISLGANKPQFKLDENKKIPEEYLPSYVDDVIELLALASTEPSTCSKGDKYYNVTSKKIFTATANNTWGSTGKNPEDGKIYLDTSTTPSTSYRWSGSEMIVIGQDLSNYVTLDSAQTITGAKTFSTLPVSSVTPTSDSQLSNKKYVDDEAAKRIMHYSTMPTASSENVGQIVQFIGTTTNNYTNGYFYKCVENSGVYSWENVDVQLNSNGPIKYYYIETQSGYRDVNTITDEIREIYNNVKNGIYFSAYTKRRYTYMSGQGTNNFIFSLVGIDNNVVDGNGTVVLRFSGLFTYTTFTLGNLTITLNITNDTVVSRTQSTYTQMLLKPYQNNTNMIYSTEALDVDNRKSYTPTKDFHPSTKKYTDDLVKSKTALLNYDAGDYNYIYFNAENTWGTTLPVNEIKKTNILSNYSINYTYTTAQAISPATNFLLNFAVMAGDTYIPAQSVQLEISILRNNTALKTVTKTLDIPYTTGLTANSSIINVQLKFNLGLEEPLSIQTDDVFRVKISSWGTPSYYGYLYSSATDPTYIEQYSNGISAENVYDTINGTTYSQHDINAMNSPVQYSTMPTASSSNEGKIVQYTGTTDSTYTNGYFYQCVSDGAVSPTYSWEAINVQASSGGGEVDTEVLTLTGDYYSASAINLTQHDLTIINKVIDNHYAGKNTLLFADKMGFQISTTVTSWFNNVKGCIYWVGSTLQITFIQPYLQSSGIPIKYTQTRTLYINNTTTPSSISSARISATTFPTNKDLYIMTFGNTTPYTVLSDYNPANKKYVDDSIQNVYVACGLSAYSSNSTYAVGDYVYKDNVVYVCNTAISTAEDWTAAHWTASNLKAYLQSELVGNALGGSY